MAAWIREDQALILRRSWAVTGGVEALIRATSMPMLPELHPLIVSVQERSDGDFEIRELLPLGPLRLPNRYRGRQSVSEDRRTIRLAAHAPGGVHLLHTLQLSPEGERVQVEHEVRVEAPWLLRDYVARTAEAAHDGWVERVKGWVEAEKAPDQPS